jgi:large subunit ribosomal protein L29
MVAAHELRKKTDAELSKFLAERRAELHELSFKAAMKQPLKPHLIAAAKRDIARCLTILRERRQALA